MVRCAQRLHMGAFHYRFLCYRNLELAIEKDRPKSSMTSLFTLPEMTALKTAMSFESLLGDSELADIQIQCGAEEFPAHKAILAGRSDVFKRMLTSDMAEVQLGIVTVIDMTANVFEIMLRYILGRWIRSWIRIHCWRLSTEQRSMG